MSVMFSLSNGSRSLRLLHIGNLELSEVVVSGTVLNSIWVKRFRNESFTRYYYFSLISGETVNSLAWDTGIENYEPFNPHVMLKMNLHIETEICPYNVARGRGYLDAMSLHCEDKSLPDFLGRHTVIRAWHCQWNKTIFEKKIYNIKCSK